MDGSEFDLTSCTADIVAAYVAHNAIAGDKLPDFISSVYAALSRASANGFEPPEVAAAISVKRAVTPEYIVCLEDGKKFKSLKRHLMTHYDLSPEDYRETWGLPRDYPMAAPAYPAARSNLAKGMGLGRLRRTEVAPQPELAASSGPERPAENRGKQSGTGAKGARK